MPAYSKASPFWARTPSPLTRQSSARTLLNTFQNAASCEVAKLIRIIVVKSSNHFRADFTPIASHVLVAKAAGPMAAEPADLPWKHLPADIRRSP